MRHVLHFISLVMALVGLVGCLYVAFGGIEVYLVASGRAAPGEPIFLDTLAQPLAESLRNVAIGIGLIALAMLVRWFIRRKWPTGGAVNPRDNKHP